MADLIFAVLAHWLVTMYVVEAEIFRPLRESLAGKVTRPLRAEDDWSFAAYRTTVRRPKIQYLLSCRMCSGFWVAVVIWSFTGFNPLVVAALSHWLFITQRIAERLAK